MKKKIAALLTATAVLFTMHSNLNAQDSLRVDSLNSPRFRPDKPHEVGISILTPVILMTGAGDDQSGRYTNLTFRYRANNRHALRLFAGVALPTRIAPNPQGAGIVTGTQVTTYHVVERSTPSNFQVGAGYEFMYGGRLKQVPAIDIVYNNVFEKEEYYYMRVREQTDSVSGNRFTNYDRIDSNNTVRTFSSDRFGINLSYSLRYPLSRRFVITSSFIVSMRYAQRRQQGGSTQSNLDFNVYGLIGDISLFYRF